MNMFCPAVQKEKHPNLTSNEVKIQIPFFPNGSDLTQWVRREAHGLITAGEPFLAKTDDAFVERFQMD